MFVRRDKPLHMKVLFVFFMVALIALLFTLNNWFKYVKAAQQLSM